MWYLKKTQTATKKQTHRYREQIGLLVARGEVHGVAKSQT